MTLSADDIKGLITDFYASDWEELALTAGDVSIVISRSGSSQLAGSTPQRADGGVAAASPAPRNASPVPAGEPVASAPAPAMAVAPVPAQPVADARSGKHVTSPTVGLFWRSPQPGSPPFVEVGQRVEANDTVCIIEVMKLLNHVSAGVAGTVVSIEQENGVLVEHGSVLMLIQPDV
jgi:acetyl-CoA carboxylase biotin carboxyl carrier protein